MKYNTPGYETLELSTQLIIKEALKRKCSIEILDEADNFIKIDGATHAEYVKQATKTSVDSYVSPLIMENKKVTKILLEKAGIRVPQGLAFSDKETLMKEYAEWKNTAHVIKPNSTNFGQAVFLFPNGSSETEFKNAADLAFKADSTVLLEEFFPGEEYRFLIIGDYVRAVLQRIPANVTGNGIDTIAELVRIKNQNPLRQKGYISPLEKIKLGNTEQLYLAQQNLSFDSIPLKDQRIFLRENSNISTGGDSIDVSDSMHPGYKDLAVAAATAVGAKICGADIVIPDITAKPTDRNYGIIELNFNPALHIHDFPEQGKNRHVERYVLDLLRF